MTDLVDRLAEDYRLFAWELDERYRRWFTQRIVDQSVSAPPADLENLARGRMTATKTFALAAQRWDGDPNETLGQQARRANKNYQRVEAVYGLVGNDIAALDEPARLRIAVERRARMADRMVHEVGVSTPKTSNYTFNSYLDGQIRAFEYPVASGTTPTAGTVAAGLVGVDEKLNQDAAQFWRTLRAGVFVLRPTAVGVRQALDALFVTFDDHFRRNWLSCDQVMAILHMDALEEVGDPNLYQTLRAENEAYLRIGNPMDVSLDVPYAKIRVAGAVAGTYTVTILGNSFSFEATGHTISDIRDGLVTQIKRGRLPLHVTGIDADTLGIIPHHLGAVQPAQLAVASTGAALDLTLVRGYAPLERFFATEPALALRYFRQGTAALDSLFVGDHVYIHNHPAYDAIAPGDFWAGEHCVVVRGMGDMIALQGHGVPPRSLSGMVNEMLVVFNSELKEVQGFVLTHWSRPQETNPDGSPGLPKNANSNGTTPELFFRRRGAPANQVVRIKRNVTGEQILPPFHPLATWHVLYKETEEARFDLFNKGDGSPRVLTPDEIPGLQQGLGGMTPRQVWVIRPDQP